MAVDENLITEWERDYLTADTNLPQDTAGDINADLDDYMRSYKSVVRLEADNKPWYEPFPTGTIFTFSTADFWSITVSGGDHTAILEVGRRLRITFDNLGTPTEIGGHIRSATFNAGTNTTKIYWNSQRVKDTFTTKTWLDGDNITILDPGSGVLGGIVLPLYNDEVTLFKGTVPGDEGRMFTRRSNFLDPVMDGYIVTFGILGSQVSIDPADEFWVQPHRMLDSTATITSFEVGAVNREAANQQTHQSGSVQLPGNGTVGPYLVTLPQQHVNAAYQVHLQVTSISHDPPTAGWDGVLLSVDTKTAFDFTIVAAGAIAIGNIITVDWIVGA